MEVVEFKGSIITVEKPQLSDILFIADNLRKVDTQELVLGDTSNKPINIRAKLLDSCNRSKECFIVKKDGKPIMVFGIATYLGTVGSLWLLSTDEIKQISTVFLRRCSPWVYHLLENFTLATNQLWIKNKLHIRWLKWLGAKFVSETRINNHRFVKFIIWKELCVSQ